MQALEGRRLLANIVVNSTADTITNDGVTTLREAINTANSTSALDVITFNLGAGAHTINLGSALPSLTRPVEITGPGASLLTVRRNGSSNYRIFRASSNVVLSGMTISNARVNDSLGGAVENEGTLTMNDCVITGNAEIAGVRGGGIVNFSTLTLNRCTISGNTSIAGAGLNNLGTAVITECTFSGNQATGIDTASNRGGALYNNIGAQLTLTRSTIGGNTAVSWGGGLYNIGTASIAGCTFVDNTAGSGGAIYQLSQVAMTVTNSTFTRNTASEGAAVTNGTQATLTGCTIVGNNITGSGLFGRAALAGGNYSPTPVITMANNIVALNYNGNEQRNLYGSFLVSNSNPNPFNPWGDNFIGDWRSFDDRGGEPMLGPLADNGGPTQTMAPLPGSPCLDAGNNTSATTEDQRGVGFSRVSGAKIDFGAYEAQSVIVDNTGDQSDGNHSSHNLTLREAIELAAANPRLDVIRFADDVFSTPQIIDTAGFAIAGELDIRGPGAKLLTIRGPVGQADVFDTGDNLYLADLTLQNRGQGAAIDNHNTLSLRRVVVSGASGSSGPGMVTSGTTTAKYSTFMDNAGGGIINLGGSVTLYNSTLSRNSTAIRNESGALGLTFVTISGNSGEGVHNSGTVSVSHTIIALSPAGDVVNASGGTADLAVRNFIGTRDGDPMLMPLADNGGSTPTMALRPYSPCINAGFGAASYVLDQRGTSRSRIAEIGAYEFTGPFNNSLVVNTTADEDNGSADPAYGTGTSLREALFYARETPGPDVITFALGASPQVIQLSRELQMGGGITIRGPGADLLTVRGSSLSGNRVFQVGSIPPSADPVEFSGLTITNAKASGIAVLSGMTVRVVDCVISGNSASSGAGIYNSGGQLTLTRSTVGGNSANGAGGGIYSSNKNVTIDSSTISNNTAGTGGGGIYLSGTATGTATITQSTISGNSANGAGGAIYLSTGGLTISHSTIANNSGSSTGGILNNAGSLTLANTIVAKNTGGDLGTIGTTQYNATFSFIGQSQGDPLLGPLADNGGPTKTMALLPGSPLINAGDPAFTGPPDFDQRGNGHARIIGGRVDIGAFELNTAAPLVQSSQFVYATAPQSLVFTFSTDVSASLGVSDLLLENLTTSTTIPAANVALSYNHATNTATFTFPGYAYGALPDGNYRATLLATGVTDTLGTPLAFSHVSSFFFLNGDADRDRDVDLDDFNILAANFNTTGRTFSQGNFSYDPAGNVNLDDFNILAGRFNTSLQALGISRRGDRSGQVVLVLTNTTPVSRLASGLSDNRLDELA